MQENGRTVRDHRYQAEGTAVEGSLVLPHLTRVEPQAQSQILPTSKSKDQPARFYESQHAESFRVEGILSYGSAHTQAAGHQETKEKGGTFKSLATSVVEDLNFLNVVTCDRVVAQVSTTYPRYADEGDVPSIIFLGTTFVNLRIGGYPVQVTLNMDLLNPKTAAPVATDGKDTQYSLVTGVTGDFPGTSNGNELDIPNFGKVYLGVVRIKHHDYKDGIPKTTVVELTMIDVRMGSVANGTVVASVAKSGGGGNPG